MLNPHNPVQTGEDPYLHFNQVRRLGVPFTLNYARVLWKKGKFPPPVRLSDRHHVWRRSTIVNWLAAREAAAQAEAA